MTVRPPERNARRGAPREFRDLDRCDHLLALHLTEAVHRLGSPALEVIDLPPLSGAPIEPGQLRSAATLFWAMEVDRAGLLDLTDALAEGLTKGTLLLPLEAGADKLAQYWRGRHERFSSDERQALYSRVFEAPEGDPSLDDLAGALADAGAALDFGPHRLARIELLARELAERLSRQSAGITAWAAGDIVRHIRAALALLGDPDVAGPLGGGGGPWSLVRLQSATVLGHPIDPEPHLERARAGLALLGWLADAAGGLAAGGHLRLGPRDPVVAAAATWRAVTEHA